MRELGQHIIAAIGWDREHGWDGTREAIDRALEVGVGGFLIRGGPRGEVAQLCRAIHAHAPVTPLVAADLERGAGERFHGAVCLPPAGALAALNDAEAVRRAARVTAREARELGINWALGPVCDLDLDNGSPIVGTRGFGADAARVAELSAEWIDACQAENVLACAKHFPGHGRATVDSHFELPVQGEPLEIIERDLLPFHAAIEAGVASVMTAHVAFTSLDTEARPATMSPPTIALLRQQLGFESLIVSDAMGMGGVGTVDDEPEAAVNALAAGCDLLLAPTDPVAVSRAIAEAVSQRRLDGEALLMSRRRREWWATWGRWTPETSRGVTLDDRMWAKQVSDRALTLVRGRVPWLPPSCEVVMVDDDAGGTSPASTSFVQSLQSLGRRVNIVPGATPSGEGVLVIAVFADVSPGRGHAVLTQQSRLTVRLAVQAARTLKRDSLVVLFGHPRLADELPDAAHLLCAWSGDKGMQEAAARALVS